MYLKQYLVTNIQVEDGLTSYACLNFVTKTQMKIQYDEEEGKYGCGDGECGANRGLKD
jgi:hypothetical protein